MSCMTAVHDFYIMSSSHALCLLAVSEEAKTWLPGLLHWPSKSMKKYLKTRTHKTQKGRWRWQRSCLLITWKKKKLRELEEKKELAQTLKTYILCWSVKERICLMYNKTIITFGFWEIQNNQGLSKGYQPQPSASADNPYLDLDYSGQI